MLYYKDKLLHELYHVQYSYDGKRWRDWKGSLILGDMESKANIVIKIAGTVCECARKLTNSAQVGSDTHNPDLSNNRAEMMTKVC